MPPFPALTTWLRDRPLVADTLMAAGLCGATLMFAHLGPAEFWPDSWLLFTVVAPIAVIPIAVRRRWLWPAIIAITALCALPILNLDLWSTQSATLIVLLYTAAAYLSLRAGIAATLLMWAPAMVVALLASEQLPYSGGVTYTVVTNAVFGLVLFLIGRTVHTRRAYASALEERANVAVANQRELASQAVADERRRIARELHDVVAHHVSVMGVLASGARRTGQRDPRAAETALAAIEETGRSAMRELRRLLDVLRTEEEPPELAPQPGLVAVRLLIDQLRDTGLPVTAHLDPGPDDLDPGLALAAYRIVQEALTNTIKHAGRASAVVRIDCTADELTIEVTDDGRGPSLTPSGVGHGLVGMRERVILYGGELVTGPRTGGGFRVYARLPMENAPRAGEPVADHRQEMNA
ncbi:MAG: sensor histidine kinase [Micromonosporaceae bacterium]